MRVNIQRQEQLPSQAWLLHCRDGVANAALGRKVSLSDHAFFEGGWALTPGPEALLPTGIHLGSGVVWKSGRLTLIAPSHALDLIWVAETANEVWATNSLALIVAATRPEHFRIWGARRAIRTLTFGLSRYQRSIYQKSGIRIWRFMNAFVEIEPGQPPTERQQQQEADFNSYETYVAFLIRALREAVASYGKEMTVYLSRGYDSPAVAALARGLGPVTAICVDRTAAGKADDGSMIARALGIPAMSVQRKARPTRVIGEEGSEYAVEVIRPDDYEDVFEFFCGVHIADECMRAPDELVAGRAVLTGWFGDAMWGSQGRTVARYGATLRLLGRNWARRVSPARRFHARTGAGLRL